MNKKVKKLWVDALTSGEYKQTKGTLKDETGFCCLGVLCDIYTKETKNGVWREECGLMTFDIIHEATNTLLECGEGVPPNVVVNWAGLDDDNPTVKGVGKTEQSLAEWNDGGKTFEEMAEIINKHL
jgi:hypothetical protein